MCLIGVIDTPLANIAKFAFLKGKKESRTF